MVNVGSTTGRVTVTTVATPAIVMVTVVLLLAGPAVKVSAAEACTVKTSAVPPLVRILAVPLPVTVSHDWLTSATAVQGEPSALALGVRVKPVILAVPR